MTFAQNQNVLPPSPNASALGKFVDNPVSLHIGLPSISIPLYTVKLKGLDVPIGLNYHAGGIKVEEVASSVGLGWSLQAGGVITRAVRDVPDDARYDYCPDDAISTRYTGNNADLWLKCAWGYLYALESPKDIVNNVGYFGPDTYNMDLDLIYHNRANVHPEDSYLAKFNFPLWGLFNASIEQVTYSSKQLADKEPDIFYFNFVGKSGKFVFDVQKGQPPRIKTIPYQKIDIRYTTDPGTGQINSFVVIDDDGMKYTFKDIEVTKNVVFTNGYDRKYNTYNSSWFLSKIETPLGDFLDFTYNRETQIIGRQPTMGVNMIGARVRPNNNYKGDTEFNADGVIDNITAKRLECIENQNVKISFEANYERQDIHNREGTIMVGPEVQALQQAPRAIDGIIIYDKIGNTPSRTKRFKLDHDYFLSDKPSYQGSKSNFPLRNEAGNLKRLRLKSVQEFGDTDIAAIPKYEFSYKYYDYTLYAHHQFPNRFTFDQDLWGYYNGASNLRSNIPALHVYPEQYEMGDARMFRVYPRGTYSGTYFKIDGANRLPNADYMDIGTLKKIKYPTGGVTEYEFEPHRFLDEGEEFEGGGLRVKKIVKNSGNPKDGPITYEYKYNKPINGVEKSSGKIVSMPVFGFLIGNYNGTLVPDDGSPEARQRILSARIRRFSTPQAEIGNTSGSNVGYTLVTEFISGNGKTEYAYSFPVAWGEKNDIPGSNCSLLENGYCDNLFQPTKIHNIFMRAKSREEFNLEGFPETSLSYPFPPDPNYEWNRGHLLSKTYYDQNDKTVKKEIHEYKNYFPDNMTAPYKVYGIKDGIFFPKKANGEEMKTIDSYSFRVAKYEILTDVVKMLAKTTEISYSGPGNQATISSIKEYNFDSPYHNYVTQSKQRGSTGEVDIIQSKYSADYPINSSGVSVADEGIYPLIEKKIFNRPIEVTGLKEKNGVKKVLSSEITTYKNTNGYPLAFKKYMLYEASPITDFNYSAYSGYPAFFTKDSRYQEVMSYGYDLNGNLNQSTSNGQQKKSYIWSYNGQYPVAEVNGADVKDIAYTSFENKKDLGGWIALEQIIIGAVTGAPGGHNVGTLPPSDVPFLMKKDLKTERKYFVSYWHKEGSNISVENLTVANPIIYPGIAGPLVNGWRRVTCIVSNASSIGIFGSGSIDEVSIYPIDSELSTYTYRSLGALSSTTDAKGIITYYEYDGLQRLKCIKDQRGNIIKSFDYHYKP